MNKKLTHQSRFDFDQARAAIERTHRVDEVKRIRDQAEALRVYARQAKEAPEMIRQLAEIKVRAERRAGELLLKLPKQHGARGKRAGLHGATPPTLAELGIDKTQSHRWQQLAKAPQEDFERALAALYASGREPTTAVTVRVLKSTVREDRTPRRVVIRRDRQASKVSTAKERDAAFRCEVQDARDEASRGVAKLRRLAAGCFLPKRRKLLRGTVQHLRGELDEAEKAVRAVAKTS